MPQDFKQDQRGNAMQMIPRMDKEFTLGGSHPLFLELNKGQMNEHMLQAGQNETVYPTLNFEPKSGQQQIIDSWGLNFGNFKQIVPHNDRQNKSFMEENMNPNFLQPGKRQLEGQGDGKNDPESYGKKVKPGHFSINEVQSKGQRSKRDEQFYGSGKQQSNVKEEGMH